MDDPEAFRCVSVMPYAGELMATMFSAAGALPEGVTAEDLSTSEYISHNGGELLLSDPHGLYGTETPWVYSTRTTRTESALDFELVGLSDLVSAFSGMEQAEAVGEEQVDGVDTTVIEGTMSSERIAALREDQAAVLDGLLGRPVPEGMDAVLWIDDAGFPMRVEFSGAGSEVSMEFSAVGETSFEIPDEDEITEI
ncbi:hypothetical protein [Nocardiopsis sp. RV163]|uniref:hypothetical protein n=1 Tax=Nocardiopsis sp. RV163 TaxID=1661388 RepID=UPI00069D5425|nr:hypothetical protein [Nocardiopsis sp. RV163]